VKMADRREFLTLTDFETVIRLSKLYHMTRLSVHVCRENVHVTDMKTLKIRDINEVLCK
jgi:hypothetical protein